MTEETKPKRLNRKRQIADAVEKDMVKFNCANCGKDYFDTGLYFYDKPSVNCLSCGKFPKKKVAKSVVNIQQALDK